MNNPQDKRTLEKISRILEKPIQADLRSQYKKKYALVIKAQEEEPKIFFLNQRRYTIGRDAGNDIQVKSKGVSRHHATLYGAQNSFWITDGVIKGKLSTNGITINQKRCFSKKLKDGDLITFWKDAYAMFFELPDVKQDVPSSSQLIQRLLDLSMVDRGVQETIVDRQAFLKVLPELMLQLDANGIILNVKESRDPIFSEYGERLIHQHILKCFPTDTAQKIMSAIEAVFRTRRNQSIDCKINSKGRQISCEFQFSMGEDQTVFAIIRNIQNRKNLENRLIHDALHDTLTGLPNRSFLARRIERSIQCRNSQRDFHFAVLLLDLDYFKVINDSLGHLIGDQFIVQIANRLKDCLRPGDFIARLGGDEFAILLDCVESIHEVVGVAKRLQAKLSKPLQLNQYELQPSASIGIAYSNLNYDNMDDILRDADTAMYHAKSSGRSRFAIFDQAMHQKALTLLKLDSDLKKAIKNEDFKLMYQPIVCLKTQNLVGFEALIRWAHPERGIISPVEFIQQAEDTGLIISIGEWVLEQTCRQLKAWHQLSGDTSSLAMTVNLSSKQFSSPNLIPHITALLQNYQLDPSGLKLEITESVVMENSKFSADIFAQLRTLGLQICIDDFGTGYSSLSYLHRFPINALKIDRSFISEMDESADNSGFAITQAIIGLAHNLGLKVIAEGIENPRHLVWLRSFQCDYGQGYFFAKPLAAARATALVKGDWTGSSVRYLGETSGDKPSEP